MARDGDTLAQRGFRSDLNLLWDCSGELTAGDEHRDELSQVTWDRYTLDQLREMGYDLHSTLSDPGFADPAGNDWTLPADSGAFALGFTPFTAAGTPVG